MQTQDQDRIEVVTELLASPARVWQALTDHKEFGEWFHVHLNEPFRLGETTTGHITYPGYEHMQWVSVTEALESERHFAFSWPPGSLDTETEYAADAKLLTEFRLEPTAQGTQLTISESGYTVFPEEKREGFLRQNLEGWNLQVKNIAEHLAQ